MPVALPTMARRPRLPALGAALRWRALAGVVAASLLSSACAPLVIGGVAAGTALVATDRRTTGTQLEDKNIGLKVNHHINRQLGEDVRIDATSFMGRVLLVGEAPDETRREQASQIAAEVENVHSVVNQVRIAPLASLEARAANTWLASKVRTALINTRGVPSRAMSLTANDGVVYLMGRVTRVEGDMAAIVASEVGGVKQVVKVFHIMTPTEARALGGNTALGSAPAPVTEATATTRVEHPAAPASSAAPAGSAAAPGSLEVIPVQ